MTKSIDENIDEGVLRWFGHVGECAGSRSPRKRWIDTVKDCLKKRGWMSGKHGEWVEYRMQGEFYAK